MLLVLSDLKLDIISKIYTIGRSYSLLSSNQNDIHTRRFRVLLPNISPWSSQYLDHSITPTSNSYSLRKVNQSHWATKEDFEHLRENCLEPVTE